MRTHNTVYDVAIGRFLDFLKQSKPDHGTRLHCAVRIMLKPTYCCCCCCCCTHSPVAHLDQSGYVLVALFMIHAQAEPLNHYCSFWLVAGPFASIAKLQTVFGTSVGFGQIFVLEECY
jgi:hypothetical protein